MRTKTTRGVLATLTLALFALCGGVFTAGGQEPRQADISQVMKEKLKHSQFLLDGLAREDFALIRDHAGELKRLGEDSLKRISPNLTYVKYCAEFVSIADELGRKAKDEDLNGVTLSYIRLTINCVDCHKFTRDERILDQRRRAK
jgi:hypothetical protein